MVDDWIEAHGFRAAQRREWADGRGKMMGAVRGPMASGWAALALGREACAAEWDRLICRAQAREARA